MSEKIWLCPAGQHLCEKYERCAYGANNRARKPQDRYDCPGPITTKEELEDERVR